MATFKQGILGGFIGKVGTVVGSTWKGRCVMRSIAQHVHNPQTTAQMTQRQKFALVSRFIAACQAFVREGYSLYNASETEFNAATRDNLNAAPFSGTYPQLQLDFDKLIVAKGTLANPGSPAAAQGTSHSVDVTWTDNTGSAPEILASDRIMVVVYNKEKECSTYDCDSAIRSDASLNITYPSTWSGDNLVVYLAAKSADASLIAGSAKIGTLVAQ